VHDLILFSFYVVITRLARSLYLNHSISNDFILSHVNWTSDRRMCCTLLCERNVYIKWDLRVIIGTGTNSILCEDFGIVQSTFNETLAKLDNCYVQRASNNQAL
jgi:hypothetical protein